ncbi:DUF1890 domain-containing protein [Methanobrevibacter curvatus]|uniref:DUF1890 domain-containing protein n=1 Tax=Methanobrevibacter curvatus TaxID=49547 RepID=A0A162FND7_9EURY|nr:DUF1890 domain-containing protein [Methanobrevibacter curvatus]KZX12650.1 hypothetical protein MBCUR_09800 [Methanobrevibacter curvatus]
MKKALVLLGCPESPSQTPMAIYVSNRLNTLGYETYIAANPAALKLLEVSDPNNVYIKNTVDIDESLNSLQEKDYDLLVGFVHKDAAASFFVTFYHILKTESIALIFEKDGELLEEYTNIVSKNTDAKIGSVRAFHNPNPIKIIFDSALDDLIK